MRTTEIMYLSDLPHRVVHESSSLAPIMQSEALPGLVFTYETRRSHSRIRKLEILVQIVEPVQKVPHVPPQHRQHPVVAVLAHKPDEEYAHLIEKVGLVHF